MINKHSESSAKAESNALTKSPTSPHNSDKKGNNQANLIINPVLENLVPIFSAIFKDGEKTGNDGTDRQMGRKAIDPQGFTGRGLIS